ncbi:hypothetical protein [Catenuloplanes indicus]|uniref:Uncharacterized protein n=1 Tax=Catenuloplanes indicus TaxID=137267 RepID=A0AAE3W7F4_9ACTN|nr:hypothetical protein [Catenuloplanes indicus]MDQ0370901.1 hypothetical protein [Catenuloplanes indicus]
MAKTHISGASDSRDDGHTMSQPGPPRTAGVWAGPDGAHPPA